MKNIIAFAFIVFSSFTISAKDDYPTIKLTPEVQEYFVSGGLVGVYIDKSNALTINEISKLPLNKFDWKLPLYNDKVNTTFWIVFKASDISKENRKFILEILDSRHYETALYSPLDDTVFFESSTGMKYPFKDRQYSHKNFVIDMPPLDKTEKTFYLKVHSKVVGALVFKLRTNREFASYAFYEYYYLGLYYGILFIFALYNFLLFLSTKEKVYFYYVLYILSWAYFSMTDDGMGYQFIWPEHPFISELGYHIAQPLLMITFVLYSRSFLEIPKRYKTNDRLIIFTTIIYIFFHIFSKPFESPLIYHCLFLLPFVTIFWLSISAYRQKYYPVRFFILGNTFILLGYLFRFLKDRGILDSLLFEKNTLLILFIYSRNIALVLDIIVLSLALADRLRYIKNKEMKIKEDYIFQLEINETLKDKVNLELEEKIKERTQALEKNAIFLDQLNKKLIEQSKENERINSILDKSNYELKKEVTQTKKDRILSSNMNFSEFEELFKDDLSVEKYLDGIKWENGFKCKKCNNSEYWNGIKKFSRKCKKCRYEESITAYTIFHRCKFPLNKALYIVYKTEKEFENLNTTSLSEEIDIRRNTVSDYKKKIINTINILKLDNKKIVLNDIINYHEK